MIVAFVVACAFFMETFTGTVITTALPAMARSARPSVAPGAPPAG